MKKGLQNAFLCFICFFQLNVVFAQTQYTLSLTPVKLHFAGERDEAFSPLLYDGIGASSALALERKGQKTTSILHATGGAHLLNNRFGGQLNTFFGALNFSHFFHARSDTSSRFQLGFSNRNSYYARRFSRMNNFNGRFDYLTTFGPALRFQYPFLFLGKNWEIDAVAHAQLIGFFITSGFVRSSPDEANGSIGFSEFWDAANLFHPFNGTQIWLSPALKYPIKNNNALSLSYEFEFTRLHKDYQVERSVGAWMLNLLIVL